jgi:hypothetical protein
MSLLVKPETYRIDLGDGEWVDVRRHITTGDRAHINSRAMVIAADMAMDGQGTRTARMTIDPGLWGLALLERMIVAWSDPARVTPENIGRLPEETADKIRAEIDRLNPGRSDAEKKDSISSSLPVFEQPVEAIPVEPGLES